MVKCKRLKLEKLGKLWYGYGKQVYKDKRTGKEYIKKKNECTQIPPPKEREDD